jgi:predicted secreted protein
MNKFAMHSIAALAFVATASAVFPAQAQAIEREMQNQVQLSASASVEVQQDLLTLTLAVTREGADPAALQNQLRQALETALAVAKPQVQSGAMDVRTGQFSLQPRYNRDGKITAWSGSTELVLEGRDFARIGSTAGKVQTLVINNASFSLSREARAKAEADVQASAIDRFKLRATEIAKGFGFASYVLRDISVSASDAGFMSRPNVRAYAAKAMEADAAVPMEAGKTAVTVTVSGNVQLK